MNIFEIEKLPGIEEEEIVDILKENEDVKIERIISTGQVSDWMVQEKREYVLLIQGNAVIEFNDKTVEMKFNKNFIFWLKYGRKYCIIIMKSKRIPAF